MFAKPWIRPETFCFDACCIDCEFIQVDIRPRIIPLNESKLAHIRCMRWCLRHHPLLSHPDMINHWLRYHAKRLDYDYYVRCIHYGNSRVFRSRISQSSLDCVLDTIHLLRAFL